MQSKEKNMDLTSTENEAAKKAKKADKWADKPAMEVRDLHFAYGKNKVLKGVSLRSRKARSQPSWERTDVENPPCSP